MTRRNATRAPEIDPADSASIIFALLGGAVGDEQLAGLLHDHMVLADDDGIGVTIALAAEARERRARLARVEAMLEQLQGLVSKLEGLPWYPALVTDMSQFARSGHILVAMGGAQRLVVASDHVDASTLEAGDLVYLSRAGDAVMAVAPAMAGGGETATFERERSDGRLVVRVRDEEILLRRGRELAGATLRRGSLLRIDRAGQLALEHIGEHNEGSGLFVHDIGQDVTVAAGRRARQAVERLTEALTARLVAPDLAERYGLHERRAVLLSGPPGVGKTLTVRNALQELTRRTGRQCRLAIVRPGEFESPWVGATESNIRNTFARLALEAGDQPAVLFLDEIESIGRVRGGSLSRHGDKFLAALLVEIDGLVRRGNIAVIAATNRKDLLDPALLERIAEIDIEVPRPDLDGAREIFAVHLDERLPYAGPEAGETRCAMIESAVSGLYAPNAGAKIATIHFRDGTSRAVEAREMLSGRLIEQACHRVREMGYRRSVRGEDGGLTIGDMRESIAEALERLRSTLTIHNVRSWIADLPAEIDLVKVAIEKPPVARPYRYLRAA